MTKPVSEAEFSDLVLKSEKLVMVDFWAEWCGPCRQLSPIIDELATEYEGKVAIYKCNVDENPKVAAQYGIMSIPTMVFFKGEEIHRIVGGNSKAAIKKVIDELA